MISFYQKSVYLTHVVIKWTQNKNSLCRHPAMRCYSMTMDDVVVLWNKDHWKTQDSILFEKFSSFCCPVVEAPYQRWARGMIVKALSLVLKVTKHNEWYLNLRLWKTVGTCILLCVEDTFVQLYQKTLNKNLNRTLIAL